MVTRQTLTIRQKDELTNRFVEKEVSIRSYEVSIWTLQDSFITVLKWANLENKGLIQQPKMILDVDGTLEFSFSIPMYLEPGKENPIWYNTTNGNLMISMRKIKVILNKGLKDGSEKVYEFIITKVNERHELDTLFCDVSCEGLAFHELGKRGYKLSLSAENFYAIHDKWFDNSANPAIEPHLTIDYWMLDVCGIEKVPENPVPNKWYYRVLMNWDSVGEASFRLPDKMYEDSYVSSWEVSDNKLVPAGTENAREKERPVEIEESNIYNITQTIAETFLVFCRYDYGYDENYHIISRTITFYNNFIAEQDGYIDLTYPYETSAITREMDGTDLCTKLFVRPADYEYSPSGLVTIMDVDANKSREDYILNFDYLYKFNIITDELYAAIPEYEAKMRQLNLTIEALLNTIANYDTIILDLDAKITTNKNIIANAEKLASIAREHIAGLAAGEDGIIEITGLNSKLLTVMTDKEGNKYVKMPVTGILANTIVLYPAINYNSSTPFENITPIDVGTCVPDDYGDIEKIVFGASLVNPSNNEELKTIHLVCSYSPRNYWRLVQQYWAKVGGQAEDDNESWLVPKKTLFENARDALQIILDNKLEEKTAAIADFEYMMGPALREGYWQPEEYLDYGDKYFIGRKTSEDPEVNFPNLGTDTLEEGLATIKWDDLYFETYDPKLTYQDEIGGSPKEYLIVKLDSLTAAQIAYIEENYNDLSFIYYDAAALAMEEALADDTDALHQQAVRNGFRSCHIESGCRLSWIKEGNNYYRALIVDDNKVLEDSLLKFIVNPETTRKACIGIVEYDTEYRPSVASNYIEILASQYNYTVITNNQNELELLQNAGTRVEVFPRIIVDSLSLKHTSSELQIYLGNKVLKDYEDYTVLILSPTDDAECKYYITLKPHVFYTTAARIFRMAYSISNAQTYIYLDALQVSKENALPKVAYTVKLSIYKPIILHDIYNKLCLIVHVNDNALKFENVLGYISRVEMNLDLPLEDTIEVKNYKTKFEDLFSTIVALTEAMKKNSYGYNLASNAFNPDGTINAETLTTSIIESSTTFDINQVFLDSGFDSVLVVKDNLTEIFGEAAEILGDANTSLNNLRATNIANAATLASFAETVRELLTPKVTTSQYRPTDFKPGDIWYLTDANGEIIGHYIATTLSDDLTGGDSNNSNPGWNRTYDGSLANITGSGINIDAEAGTLDLYAGSKMTLKAKSELYLASGDIQITGNNSINIGSKWVNIGSLNGGVRILSSGTIGSNDTDNGNGTLGISAVTITGSGIVMEAAEGIVIKADKAIDIKSTNSNTTSAIRINRTEGIYLGSNKPIKLYSGGVDSTGNGASVELDTSHILFGVSAANNGSVVEMNSDQIVLGVGATNRSDNVTGTSSGLIGAKFTKNSIGFAIGSGDNINAVLMNDKGITIGSGSVDITKNTGTGAAGETDTLRANGGSYVRIAGTGINIGSTANLYLNTNNIKLQTNYSATDGANTIFAIGANLNNITASSTKTALENWQSANGAVGLIYNTNGLYIAGTVYASAGSFTGAIHATSFVLGNDSHELGISDINGLQTELSSINAVDGVIKYQLSDSGNTVPTGTWLATIPTLVNGKYLWTLTTITYSGGNSSVSYSVSHIGTDGAPGSPGISISSITPLYYLKNSTTPPSKPSSHINSNSTNPDGWRVIIPTWINNYYYFRCEEYLYSDNTYGWSDPYIDYGITIANLTATSASNDAAAARTVTDAFTTNGLLTNYWWPTGTGDNHLGGKQWKVALVSTDNLLIGANSGLWIAKSANYSDGAAVTLDESGIALNGASINIKALVSDSTSVIALDRNGITMGATGNIKLLSNNIILDSTATTTSSIFELKKKANDWSELNNHYDTAMKYSITNGLEITGAITATSFLLASANDYNITKYWTINTTSTAYTSEPSGVTWTNWSASAPNLTGNKGKYLHTKLVNSLGGLSKTTYDVSYISKDGDSFSIDGLSSNYTWNNTTYGVALTSTTSLLIGANGSLSGGIIIAKNSNSAAVDINKEHINFDYDTTNYIHINNSGIEVKGNRISINENDVWARDDIIVMKQTVPENAPWQDTVEHIESYMKGETVTIDSVDYERGEAAHDWVLIKPYYNAEIIYTYNNRVQVQPASSGITAYILPTTGSAEPIFGNGASYSYTISFSVDSGLLVASSGRYLFILLKAGNIEIPINNNRWSSLNGSITGNGISINNILTQGNGSTRYTITSILVTEDSFNIAQGESLQIQFADRTGEGTKYLYISDIELTCNSSATQSKVPCTVYYYP